MTTRNPSTLSDADLDAYLIRGLYAIAPPRKTSTPDAPSEPTEYDDESDSADDGAPPTNWLGLDVAMDDCPENYEGP